MASLLQSLVSAAEAWAPAILALVLRGVVVMAGAWALAAALRRSPAAARHLLWLSALVAVLALPALAALPGWHVLPRGARLGEPGAPAVQVPAQLLVTARLNSE